MKGLTTGFELSAQQVEMLDEFEGLFGPELFAGA